MMNYSKVFKVFLIETGSSKPNYGPLLINNIIRNVITYCLNHTCVLLYNNVSYY